MVKNHTEKWAKDVDCALVPLQHSFVPFTLTVLWDANHYERTYYQQHNMEEMIGIDSIQCYFQYGTSMWYFFDCHCHN